MTLNLRSWLACACIAALIQPSVAQQAPFAFTPVRLDLRDLSYGKMAYADVDGDGDLDILGVGNTATSIPFTPAAYVGIGGDVGPVSFFNSDPQQTFELRELPGDGLWSSDARWIDYNLDGILDVIITGTTHSAAPYETRAFEGNTRLYRGTAAGTYQLVNTSLPGIYGGSVVVGDYDNDGDEDLLVTGLRDPSTPISQIYRNDGGLFTRTNSRLRALALGESKWVDLDGDGDLDLVHSGVSASNSVHTILYYNDGVGRLTADESALPGYFFSSTAWGDYDNDGDLDVAISGATLDPIEIVKPVADVYQNNGTSFVRVTNAPIPDVFYGSVGWADYDNDGDLDLMVTGATNMGNGRIARIFRQENRYFIERIWLPAVAAGSGFWGDFDGNAVVDLLLTGSNRSVQPLSRLYRNESQSANSRPVPPENLNTQVSGSSVVLSWGAGSDEQTPEAGLMYNLRIGTQPGASDVMSAYADAATGRRVFSGPGNVWQARSRTLRLAQGTYYWSVQTIDQAYAGSAFAAEGSFAISNAPGLGTAAEEETLLDYNLAPGYPNPFLDATTIGYSLRESGMVRLDVYNMLGQRVRGLVAADQPAGQHRVVWSGTGDDGSHLAAGVYFVRMIAGGNERTQRLMVLR